VVEASPGSPGQPGFALALTPSGDAVGTIGGGAMELAIVREYATRLGGPEVVREIRTLVHALDARHGEPSGLLCGGSQTVCAVSLDPADLPAVAAIRSALTERRPAMVVLSDAGLSCAEGDPGETSGLRRISDSSWRFTDRVGPEHAALIVGGGHVGSALARVLAILDLDVVVADERANLAMLSAGADLGYRCVVAPLDSLAALVPSPDTTFAVVMTSSADRDTAAMRALLPLRLRYLGLMGAKRKVAVILGSLTEAEREEFRRQGARAPAGLEIGSHSPEEIAVSVAAEIIAVRSGLG
jgi:xanthine dehydrogenase accessory factor